MGTPRTSDGLESSSVSALALNNRGALWVGTNVGISIIQDPGRPT